MKYMKLIVGGRVKGRKCSIMELECTYLWRIEGFGVEVYFIDKHNFLKCFISRCGVLMVAIMYTLHYC